MKIQFTTRVYLKDTRDISIREKNYISFMVVGRGGTYLGCRQDANRQVRRVIKSLEYDVTELR